MYSTDLLLNIVNGDIEDYDIEALAEHIQELYDNGEMSSSQYDDLMSCIQDLQLFQVIESRYSCALLIFIHFFL